MLAEYQNTLLIRELNNATSAALEQIAGLAEELETLRGDRDAERRRRIALQRQIDSLRSQNQSRAVEKNAAIAQRDTIRAGLAEYENDQETERQPGVERAGSHTNQPQKPPVTQPTQLSFGRGTKRRGLVLLVLALVPAGVLAVFLAVYIGTQLRGDHSGSKDIAGTPPASNPAASADGSTRRPTNAPSAGTSATPPVTGGGPAHGGNSSSGGGTGGSSGNDTAGGASGDASGGNTGGKTTGGSGDAGGSRGNNGSGGASGGTPATPPAPGGRFQLRNAGRDECLAVGYSVVLDTCADSPATNWTAKAGSDGSYQLYNESAGQCLSVSYNQLSMADCGAKGGQSWRTGTSSTVVNLSSSSCLEERSGWPVMGSCEPSKSTQHWVKESPAPSPEPGPAPSPARDSRTSPRA
ncbi:MULTISPECIES: ricin-type beta-trefoil lectin domain protein [unclassified Streptomyces]|uniref:RICIN domain-containing protein n=1 Tax=unclassified Streptomyces TaxID=2593676 RepID=UPI00382CAA20